MALKVVQVVGGLGSQMMAYALSVALKRAYPEERVICDFSNYRKNKRFDHNGSELYRAFGVDEESVSDLLHEFLYSTNFAVRVVRKLARISGNLKFMDAGEQKYNYDSRVFKQQGNVLYYQCWTSWRYFVTVEEDIRRMFTFRPFDDTRNEEVLNIVTTVNSVAIHIRRGDYLRSRALGGLIGQGYYRKAIEVMDAKVKDPVYFVFSDDAEWARDNIGPMTESRSVFIDHNRDSQSWKDMSLISKCRNHIIPNSSFSWWGAYLGRSPTQIVIAPEVWSNRYTGIELADMNLPMWLTLDNVRLQ